MFRCLRRKKKESFLFFMKRRKNGKPMSGVFRSTLFAVNGIKKTKSFERAWGEGERGNFSKVPLSSV